MNEVVQADNVNALSMINSFNSKEAETVNNVAIENSQKANWLPTLSIAYGTSQCVNEQKAFPGEFVLSGNESLKASIEVMPLAYRFKYQEWDDVKKEFGESLYHFPHMGDPTKSTTVQSFVNKKRDKGVKLQSGIEFLMYFPKRNVFVTFFLKSTLSSYVPIIINGGMGRLIKMSTVYNKSKKTGNIFYSLDIVPLPSVIKGSNITISGVTLNYIEVAPDKLKDAMVLFGKAPEAIADASNAPEIND